MTDKKYTNTGIPIRKTAELLPKIFQTSANEKFFSGVVDPMVQPGLLEKITGYTGRRYGKTFNSSDIYLDTDATLRSRYQLEPGITVRNKQREIINFYDYLDLKNQLKFFGNKIETDDRITEQSTYTWDPPIDWDKFINFREYYWEPLGPLPVRISGNTVEVTSTYRVSSGSGSSWIFSPDGFTDNPTLTLYRGQKYRFRINAPGHPFVIKTNYDTGSLLFDPNRVYFPGQTVLFDNKIWKAKVEISPLDNSTINEGSEDWEFIERADEAATLIYNKGITNNNIEVGDLEFEIPFDAPDTLFYQSSTDPDKIGRFLIADIDTNTFVDVHKEIVGKINYRSGNGIEFTNGMIVEFSGQTFPTSYQNDTWLVEGVGAGITLTRFSDLLIPRIQTGNSEIFFDDGGFDTQPFDDAKLFPSEKDYVLIARDSKDFNPWSRYNRWFHRSVLEFACKNRGLDFLADENLRAKRPIIEFNRDLQLFNHGSIVKTSVDFIDDFTDDVFSIIEGSSGYSVDNELLFNGARILITADTDSLVNNKIYNVRFITHNNNRQIHLELADDGDPIKGQCLLVKRGKKNSGIMYHYDGNKWIESQKKVEINQSPLFDIYDEDGVSFSDSEKYNTSDFRGSKILSYKLGNGVRDRELGFSLSYLNIDNIGDIEFQWNLEVDLFSYVTGPGRKSIQLSTGYYLFNNDKQFKNGWIEKDKKYSQILIDTITVTRDTNELTSFIIDWNKINFDNEYEILFEKNGFRLDSKFSRQGNKFVFDVEFKSGDVVVTKLITEHPPLRGYYEIPCALEKNPLNNDLISFTYGEAADHVDSALEFSKELNGKYPGVSNLRDLEDFRKFGKRFLKHSEIAPIAFFLLCDKKFNLIKSIRHTAKNYTEFKNNVIKKSTELPFNNNYADFLDDILDDINKVKNNSTQFSNSDMLGTGAFRSILYRVDDEEIKTFSLSENFDLRNFSNRAVYVYYDQRQLLHGRDYEFDENFSFLTIKIPFVEGDILEIREYNSTSFCFLPPTPTKLGLYKRFEPRKFVDDTYKEPREVIQGHDGSITLAFNDYRDDLLLEFETRIYNNLKFYDYEKIIDEIDDLLGNYYYKKGFSKEEIDILISQDFLKWTSGIDINYSKNDFFDSEDSFTYTYNEMSDIFQNERLPGFWRGIYQWFYDTDRPHRCPWEMLGFSEKPSWWENEYGNAPYTRGNLILWEDLENGIIRQGNRKGEYERYKRPNLTKIIPVNDHGELISPLDSGLAQNFVLINNRGSFKFGDIPPVEHAWRSSSEYPFSLILALCLLKPFSFIGKNFDRSATYKNRISQIVSKKSNRFVKINDLASDINELNSGLLVYLKDYCKFLGISENIFLEQLQEIDVNLSSRISGFVDQRQQKYLLDTKNANNSFSSIFIPSENYEIFFNTSSPIETLSYSGVILEKTATGWIIQGYDNIFPYFEYYESIPNQSDPLISVGGISATFQDWEQNKVYNNGQLVLYRGDYYRSLRTHNSGNDFEKSQWTRLPKLPIVGAVEALQRSNFNKTKIEKLSYGSELKTIQSVVDFLLGYEQFLIDKGFVFNQYDRELGVSRNWTTSSREFMFWTRQNWAEGSLIALSPASQEIEIRFPVGVADNLFDSFYDYQILKSDGTPIRPDLLNVTRDFQKTIIKIDENETSDGIFLAKISYVIKEHVVIFDDRTVFNDIIFDKTTGYRQERIKSFGYRTVEWDGDYTSPGFLFDNVSISSWEPFKEYKLGDVVSYRSIFWTSKVNQPGAEFFNNNFWTRLDNNPTKKLVPNFDYRINLFEDYFEINSEGVGQAQRDLARHAIGYQQRQYLENLSEDPTTQFLIYQGFIKEKGSRNAITKVFDKLSRSDKPSLEIYEEWALRIGRVGGLDQIRELEFQLEKDKFLVNPQPIIYKTDTKSVVPEKYYSIGKDSVSSLVSPGDENIFPIKDSYFPFLTAGYVNFNQIEFVLPVYDNFNNLDIDLLKENNHIWINFGLNNLWNVYRFNRSQLLYPIDLIREDSQVTIILNRKHFLKQNEFVGLKIKNLYGFFKIIAVTNDSITFILDPEIPDPEFDQSTFNPMWVLTPMRFESYKVMEFDQAALLPNGAKIWIDQDENNRWEVVEKKKQFKSINLENYGISELRSAGKKVLYDDINKLIVVSIPLSGYITTHYRINNGFIIRQIIDIPRQLNSSVLGSFGNELAISPDSVWMFVGCPLSNEVPSDYRGNFDPTFNYVEGDIVLFEGVLYRAKADIFGDGSSIDIDSQDWELADNISAYGTASGTGFNKQGVVFVYKFVQKQWQFHQVFVSPRPSEDEMFGSSISIGYTDGRYISAISAPGAANGIGRVYLYTLINDRWSMIRNNNEIVDFLPRNSFYDGLILQEEFFQEIQSIEVIKQDERFGSKISMDNSGEILVIGAPDSDGQIFENYRGIWRPNVEYVEGDIVKYEDQYYRLGQRAGESLDSSTRSFNEIPEGLPWENVGDSSAESTGKVFIYRKNQNNRYVLQQTITAQNLSLYSDIESGLSINVGDQFGFSIDVDISGNKLVVSSPRSDKNFQNQGSVYIFEREVLSDDLEYRLRQKLESFEDNPNEYFGQDVKISPNTEKIVIGAKNSPYVSYSTFDFNRTIFDQNSTEFYERKGFAGGVYVFEQKDSRYFLVEKLEADLNSFESFGYSIDCNDSLILVGSPDYSTSNLTDLPETFDEPKTGIVRLFEKESSVKSWQILEQQQDFVDISKIKNISIYDVENSLKITDIDLIDPINFKILNIADKELKFKTEYDPAAYNIGNSNKVIVDESICWREQHVGELWWDISFSRWVNYNQGDINYKISNWGRLAPGSIIRVCEWVESRLLPSEWAILADTTEGLAQGISGQPLYPEDENYTVKELFNPITGESTETLYYYWVENKNVLPDNKPQRRFSAADVAILIRDPAALGISFAALIDKNTVLAYNFDKLFRSEYINFNVIYSLDESRINKIHNEYQIISEDSMEDNIDSLLELKWIDSLIGTDSAGNRIPDDTLPQKQRIGTSFRPRQSIFVDRFPILEDTIKSLNSILRLRPFADQIDMSILLSKEDFPSISLNLYDAVVDQDIDLQNVGTVRVKPARLSANILDGNVNSIDILDPGFGYKVPPPVKIFGDGINAEAQAVLDNQGRILRVDIVNPGRKYSQANVSIRPFSVLVKVDKTQNNLWSIYSWDDVRKEFFGARTQSFDVSKFWKYVDWWKEQYSEKNRIVKELDGFFQEPLYEFQIGDLIKISNYGSGGWAVLEKVSNDLSNNYALVGRQNGTIEISNQIYDSGLSGIGFDGTKSFDTGLYDLENTIEIRKIFESFKKDILVGDLKIEWKKLFFKSLRYAFVEQQYVDWAFKTSFVKVKHNIGFLEKKLNFKNDNIDSYLDYFNEIKPYKTTVRSFVTDYQNISNYPLTVTDFDLPPIFSTVEGKIIPINETNSFIENYPWKWWTENSGYEVIDIQIVNPGQGYTTPPRVVIDGDGEGAIGRSFISNGKVSRIIVESSGQNYKTAPKIILVGGTRNENVARASAIIGKSKVRTFDIKIKFDRTSKNKNYESINKIEQFISDGKSSVFDLKYPANRVKTYTTVEINNELILNSEYNLIRTESKVENNTILKSRIVFRSVPEKDSVIVIKYRIDDELLDSVSRIEEYYQPNSGMKSKQLNQLMTGIDFGGVKIQGTTFDVTGGWDALPWFTDAWDSVSVSSDFYFVLSFEESLDSSKTYNVGQLVRSRDKIFVCVKKNIDNDGDIILPFESTNWEEFWQEFFVKLPFVPAIGQFINVYLKKSDSLIVRIDDPNFGISDNSSQIVNINALMPTIIGDGISPLVDINTYDLNLSNGDTLIFRLEDSDGSVTITDRNILDTQLSGGSLASIAGAYSTASGFSSEEILVDGNNFISPDHVPSPEENIPGQVLESLSIKVFNNTFDGSAPLQTFVRIADGFTKRFNLGLRILENRSVIVYVDKIKKTLGIEYEIIWNLNSIEFVTPPSQGSVIEIVSVGIGGIGILDVQEFLSDGETDLFLTDANYDETSKVYVTVNGELVDISFINSSDILDVKNRTLVQFAIKPERLSVIKIIVLSSSLDSDSISYNIIKVNKESFIYDGSSRKIELANFIKLQRGSIRASSVVEINGYVLTGVDSVLKTYNGSNNSFELGSDPFELSGSILPENISVYINNELKTFVREYDYDIISKILVINENILSIGDIIKIEVDLRTEYDFDDTGLILLDNLQLTEGDVIDVTWFDEYPTMNIVSDEFSGGKVYFRLKSKPLDISYVWVYKNRERLSQDLDYYIVGQNLYLRSTSSVTDSVKIVQFGSKIYRDPSAYEIYKDMFNIDYFKRYSIGSIKLSRDLNYYDQEIYIDNADRLYNPLIKGRPGIITINAEKIAYFKKEGNVISQLRRGVLGSSIIEIHRKDSKISDFSETETIPYVEEQQRYDFVTDGSSLLIGPLPFVPKITDKEYWFKENIPPEYGPCYEIEVFVAGRRLRKDPIDIYDESLGSYSPIADKKIQAEFSVDGTTPFVRLSDSFVAGLRIIVIRKQGKLWYDRMPTSTSNLPLIDNSNKIAKFIAKKNTELPE